MGFSFRQHMWTVTTAVCVSAALQGADASAMKKADSSSTLTHATVAASFSLTSAVLPGATQGSAYSTILILKGGTSSFVWSVASGSLPAGLTLSTSTGQISGTPTRTGISDFTVQVADKSAPKQTSKAKYVMIVNAPALVLAPPIVAGSQVGVAYSLTPQASGGTPAYKWSLTSGSLAPGLSLSPSTGQITGTPTSSGSFEFTLQVTDSASSAQVATSSLALTVLPAAITNTAYFFSNTGSDANPGTSASTPFATVAKANAMMNKLKPGDSILFKAGDVFRDDYLRCGTAFTNTGSSTITSAPPPCSGIAGNPVTIGAYGTGSAPVIDAADPLELSWAPLSGNTSVYYAQLPTGASVPQKLFVDCPVKECPQLLPVPNAEGAWNASKTYKYLDAVSYAGSTYVYGWTKSSSNMVPNGPQWVNISNGNQGNATQAFPGANTGLQNVALGAEGVSSKAGYGYPTYSGVFWYDGNGILYVKLADGSSPNTHTFEATHRPYGIVLEGVNYVTVQGLTFEHAGASCALSYPYASDKKTYFVGEHNTFSGVSAWNCAGIASDSVLQQEHTSRLRGGIVLFGDGQYNPRLEQGNEVVGSYVGALDNYFATPGDNDVAGIFATGQDGGGTANLCVVCSSKIQTVTSPGLVYSAFGTFAPNGTIIRVNGGRIAGNEFTNNQGNIFFSDVVGGSLDHNYVHESYAEGVQLGGNSTSGSTAPQLISSNVIVNLGKGASLVGYNGIDCNSYAAVQGVEILHNTIWNTWGAGATFEGIGSGGCAAPVIEGNIIGQDATPFPAGSGVNGSYVFYTDASVRAMGTPTSNHNLYEIGGGVNFANDYSNFAKWVAGWSETDSVQGNPMFVSPTGGNWRLQAGSPARGLSPDGTDAGALPFNAVLSLTSINNPALN